MGDVVDPGTDPLAYARDILADALSRITVHPVKLPGNDFYSVIAEDMAAPLAEALAAAGLLRDQPAETRYRRRGTAYDGWLPAYPGEAEEQQDVHLGPWRPVEDADR